MAKGQVVKDEVTKKIIAGLGDAFVGIQDKKIYAVGKENGEEIQVAISLTCPKTPIAVGGGQ